MLVLEKSRSTHHQSTLSSHPPNPTRSSNYPKNYPNTHHDTRHLSHCSRSSSRCSAYIGIRNFYVKSASSCSKLHKHTRTVSYSVSHRHDAACPQYPPSNISRAKSQWLQEQEALFSHISRTRDPTTPPTFTLDPRQRNLTAAEREWLQEEQFPPSSSADLLDPPAPMTRFDWRLRATSRVSLQQLKPLGDQPLGERHSQYIKRMQPPQVNTEQGRPFHDAIQTYQKRYVSKCSGRSIHTPTLFLCSKIFKLVRIRRFLSLLAAEQAEDEAVLKERLSNWTLNRLKEEGYCLTGLSAFWLQANQFGRPVASFLLGPGLALPEHRFEFVQPHF